MLQLHNLTIGHRERALAASLCATLPIGSFTALVGRNGCGKSTLLRTIATLLPPSEGEIRVGNENLAQLSPNERARRIALVLTERVSAPALSAREVVEMGRAPYSSFFGRLDDNDRTKINQAVKACRIENLLHREIGTLSDGERQRVMIARALAQDTPVILLDEPTAFLDFPAKVETLTLLRDIAHTQNKTILLSTHDLELTFQLADYLWLLSPTNLTVGTPETLAAEGTLTRYFESETLCFDAQHLRFTPQNLAP